MSRGTPFTFYEFFAGGGMAGIGLGDSWRCLFANDFDPMKARTYRDNFGVEHFHEGDVWQLEASDLPGRADLAWASSPCQDFSLAGARAGLAGGRSSAFFGFWRLIEGLAAEGRAPRVIVVENVVGLLTSHAGQDFAVLCEALAGQGYSFGALEIDAARFVPQSRPRVFMVATRTAPATDIVSIEPVQPFHSRRVVAAFDSLPDRLKSDWIWWHLRFPPSSNMTVREILDAPEDCRWLSAEKRDHLLTLLSAKHREKLARAQKIGGEHIATVFRRMRVENGVKVQRAELRFDGFAGCLRTPRGGSSKQLVMSVRGQTVRVRPLSPTEGARLMGLADEYKLPPRKNAALGVIGDGVVVPVVRFLADSLLERLAQVDEAGNHAEERKQQLAYTG